MNWFHKDICLYVCFFIKGTNESCFPKVLPHFFWICLNVEWIRFFLWLFYIRWLCYQYRFDHERYSLGRKIFNGNAHRFDLTDCNLCWSSYSSRWKNGGNLNCCGCTRLTGRKIGVIRDGNDDECDDEWRWFMIGWIAAVSDWFYLQSFIAAKKIFNLALEYKNIFYMMIWLVGLWMD